MLYGIQDIARSMIGMSPKTDTLRPGEFWSVDSVSFEVKRGECLGLIGPNGAGKSTLLKMLNGIISPDKGRIEIKGRVGALIEVTAGFHPMLTGRENIYINGSILGLSKKEIDKKFDAIVEFSELEEFIDTPVKYYSSGMKVRLGFAIAAQMEPDVLLIDEVLAVGDAGFRAKCFNAINELTRSAAVIVVSHSMPAISRICSNILVLQRGRVAVKGNNVHSGIEYYYSQFEQNSQIIYENGKAIIHSVFLESNGKINIQKIDFLDDLIIHLIVTVDRSVEYPSFHINFYDIGGQIIIQSCSFHAGEKIKNTEKPLHVIAKFPNLNLNPGVYYIETGIMDEYNKELLVRYSAVKKLIVSGYFVGYAPVQYITKWDTVSSK